MLKELEPVIRQYIYETESWRRLLTFLQQETTYLKTRLADLVSSTPGTKLVAVAEEFQERFIAQDRAIDFLSAELRHQEALLHTDLSEPKVLFDEIVIDQLRLRKDIQKVEQLFYDLEEEFATHLAELFVTG
jgi:hypothetical protein